MIRQAANLQLHSFIPHDDPMPTHGPGFRRQRQPNGNGLARTIGLRHHRSKFGQRAMSAIMSATAARLRIERSCQHPTFEFAGRHA